MIIEYRTILLRLMDKNIKNRLTSKTESMLKKVQEWYFVDLNNGTP